LFIGLIHGELEIFLSIATEEVGAILHARIEENFPMDRTRDITIINERNRRDIISVYLGDNLISVSGPGATASNSLDFALEKACQSGFSVGEILREVRCFGTGEGSVSRELHGLGGTVLERSNYVSGQCEFPELR
jgi:hypothetical protein